MSTGFYLKVAFNSKIKKYLVTNPNQINFPLINSSLGVQQSSTDSLLYYQLQDLPASSPHSAHQSLTQKQVISELFRLTIAPKSTIKMKIIQKKIMSEQQKHRKQSQESLQIPSNIQKKRSKSMEFSLDVFDQTCKTSCFDGTLNFIVNDNNCCFEESNSFAVKQDTKLAGSNDSYSFQDSVVKDKKFSKSTQIHIQTSSQSMAINTSPFTSKQMSSSLACSMDLGRLSNLLKQSMRINQKQKDQLQKLKDSIKRKEESNKIKQKEKLQEVNDVLELFGVYNKCESITEE